MDQLHTVKATSIPTATVREGGERHATERSNPVDHSDRDHHYYQKRIAAPPVTGVNEQLSRDDTTTTRDARYLGNKTLKREWNARTHEAVKGLARPPA